MKKISILAMVMVLLLTLSTVAMAEENALTLSDASVREDETIYLTLRLNTSVIGDALGVSYTFDSAVLEPVLSSCTWSQKGSISNFNKEHAGVWATDKAKDLAGDICVLAFRVKPGVKLTETTVSCTLIVKNGSVSQGTFTAQAKITYACNHTYGDWETGNESGHTKACTNCGSTVFQPHTWNSGEIRENPDDPEHNWLVFTCEVCGSVYQREVPKSEEPPAPAGPTEPTAPVTVPSMPTMPPETHPIPTEPPTGDGDSAQTAPTASNNPGSKEPVRQTDPTLPPQETLPRDPEAAPTQPSQGTTPAASEDGSKDKDSASGENDRPTEKDENPVSGPGSTEPSNDPPEGTDPNRPQNSQTEPTTRPSYPDNSSNAVPKTEPTAETTEPAVTTEATTPYNDYNTPPPQTTRPLIIPVTTEPPVSDDHDHDHDSVVTEEQGDPVVNALMITAVLAVAVGGAKLYLKKKRK